MNIYFRGETHHVKLQTHKNRALYVQLSFSGSSYDLKIQASQSYFWNNMAQIKGRAVGAGFIINGLQIQYCYQNVILRIELPNHYHYLGIMVFTVNYFICGYDIGIKFLVKFTLSEWSHACMVYNNNCLVWQIVIFGKISC